MAEVFLVVSGEYSDYAVDGVFSTRALAESVCNAKNPPSPDLHARRDYRVEPMPLDAVPERSGAVTVYVNERGVPVLRLWNPDEQWGEPTRLLETKRFESNGQSLFVGTGATEEHARRSAEELRRATVAVEGFRDGDIREALHRRAAEYAAHQRQLAANVHDGIDGRTHRGTEAQCSICSKQQTLRELTKEWVAAGNPKDEEE